MFKRIDAVKQDTNIYLPKLWRGSQNCNTVSRPQRTIGKTYIIQSVVFGNSVPSPCRDGVRPHPS